MPQNCCVPNCRNVARKGCKISFFSFPRDVCRRQVWTRIVQTNSNQVNNNSNNLKVCGRHFQPSDFIFGANPRKLKKKAVPSLYVPNNPITVEVLEHILSTNNNVNMNQSAETHIVTMNEDENVVNKNETVHMISENLIKQEPKQSTSEVERCNNLSYVEEVHKKTKVVIIKRKACNTKIFNVNHVEDKIKKEPLIQYTDENSYKEIVADQNEACSSNNLLTTLEIPIKDEIVEESLEKPDIASSRTIELLEKEIEYLKKENLRLKELSLPKPIFTLANFMNNDKKIFYYTGFHTYSTFKDVFDLILPSGDTNDLNLFIAPPEKRVRRHSSHLSGEDQFFLTLIRLRRGLHFETLGDLFNIATSTAGKLFLGWLNVLYLRLGSNIWPHRDEIIQGSPVSAQEMYPNLIGSIGCTEISIQKPTSSNYKNNTTLKSLIMISPNGRIIYASPLLSGSLSDKAILEKSGYAEILKNKVEKGHILPEDIILADKAFNVVDLLNSINLELNNIPVFRISDTQFAEEEEVQTKRKKGRIIHVGKTIDRLRIYNILCNTIPRVSLGNIEQIYHVCCWLTNFRFPLKKS